MLTRHLIVRDGLVAGLIGASCVAVWFLLVDLIAGRPFYTPAVLGSATFFGLRDPATVTIAVQPVVAYTMMHVFLFLFTGLLASASIAEAEREPMVLWLLAEFFIVFEVGFYAVVGLLFAPLLAGLAWTNVAAGNLIAAGSMGYYLWTVRPALRQVLSGRPTGDAE